MGLDQYAGYRNSKGNVIEDKFYWRKHARLQEFMSKEFDKQHEEKQKHNSNLQHLGFNGGEGGVKITKELISRLKKAIENKYYDFFVSDGFFWGQQFQEEQVKEYEKQDKEFVEWAEKQLIEGEDIGYDCSW